MRQKAGEKPVWYLTSLEASARTAKFSIDEQAAGFRFRPGVMIDNARLVSIVQKQPYDNIDIATAIGDCVSLCRDTEDALTLLSEDFATVQGTAKTLGVSTRTLQRKVLRTTGKSPSFWLALARSRKAVNALGSKQSLVSTAAEYGFSDQAHLTREVKRWFGLTPGQIRSDPHHLSSILGAGYAIQA